MGHDGMVQMPRIAVDISAQGWRFLILGEGQGGGWAGAGNLWMGTFGVPISIGGARMVPVCRGECMGIIVGYSRVKLALPRT